jgi:hypothetical protein
VSNKAFIRYFCAVTSHKGDIVFGDMGFAYFQAMHDAGFTIRVIATNMAALWARNEKCETCDGEGYQNGKDCAPCEGLGYIPNPSRWEPFNEEFVRPVPKQYVNVICGTNGELVRLYTVGVKNIAITASFGKEPSDDELETLKLYDDVILPSQKETERYRSLGVEEAIHVSPDATTLSILLKDFI